MTSELENSLNSLPDSEKVLASRKETVQAFEYFFKTIQTLRSKGGCPWDRDQTPLSMRRDLVEETFEAVDAITQNDAPHAKEELGDVLLNATMISLMYEQNGDFKVSEVLTELADKLIRRHPHVFPQSAGASEAKEKVKTGEEVLNQWDRIKQNVEGRKGDSILDEVPEGFPPLLRAYKLQKKAAKKGFDWPSLEPTAAKVTEELDEVKEARGELEGLLKEMERQHKTDGKLPDCLSVKASPEQDKLQLHVEEEIGDLFFAVVNYARKLGVDPETALNRANRKFYNRFTYIEKTMKEMGTPMDSAHLAEEDSLWQEAKKQGL